MERNVLPEIWEKIKNKQLLEYLNYDILGAIILDEKAKKYWLEFNSSSHRYITKQARKCIESYMKRFYKATYLFD